MNFEELKPSPFKDLQTLVEASHKMARLDYPSHSSTLSWEQEEVPHLQQSLNTQSAVSVITRLPPAHSSVYRQGQTWNTQPGNTLGQLDSLIMSSTSSTSPPSRLALSHQRSAIDAETNYQKVRSHSTYSSTTVQYVNLDGHIVHTRPVLSANKPPEKMEMTKSVGSEEYRPCLVCRERAGKHSYYGGQVCPSCRAFFRRSVQSGYNATYFCPKDGNCQVNLKTRKSCQFCRYKLCEDAGMKTAWVLTDLERKQKFEGRGKRKIPLINENEDNLKSCIQSCISSADVAHIDRCVLASSHSSQVRDMDTSLIRQIIRLVAFQAKLDEVSQQQLRTVMLARSTRFASRLTEFEELCPADREEILTHNLGNLVKLATCSMFSPHITWTSQLSPLLGAREVDKLNTKLRSLNVTGLDSLHLTYNMFFSNHQQEGPFIELMIKIGSWSEDQKEHTLLSLVILFCPDMLDLTERRKVEDFQLRFATLLQNYLNYKHQSDPQLGRSRFTSGMLLVSKCKEICLVSLGESNMAVG